MEIDINKSFTLKNFRGRDVVFDGSSEKWFFTIAEGKTVVFDGISFTDGGVKGHASIENYGTLIINNCSFESFETGEIIYNSGLLNILNATFSMNSVNDAIVWNDKDLFIDTVEFSYNIVNTSSVVYTNGAAEIISDSGLFLLKNFSHDIMDFLFCISIYLIEFVYIEFVIVYIVSFSNFFIYFFFV